MNYEINKFISQKRSYRKYWFKFIDFKKNAISGETVPLMYSKIFTFNNKYIKLTG